MRLLHSASDLIFERERDTITVSCHNRDGEGNAMEMQQIRYFVALCDTLNFTRAARACNVSQPSLTRAIKDLEDEFGGVLFHRERNNIHLTELGRTIQPYLSQIHIGTLEAKSRAKSFSKLEQVSLKIGVMCTVGPRVIGGFIQAFERRHPGVELMVLDAGGARISDLLIGGDIELAVFGLPEGLDPRLHALPLYQERFGICFPMDHRFQQMNCVNAKDLHGEPYCNRANCEFNDYAGQCLQAQGVRVKRVFRSEREDWVQAMVKAGLGFGFFPEYSVTEPDLSWRPLVEPEFTRTINLATVRGRPHSPAVGAFMREAKSYKWVEEDSHPGDSEDASIQ
jgi:DNA-binding transcriptional LysR family regulator